MNIASAIDNLRDLRDEALRLKPDMDYDRSLQIARFCNDLIVDLGQDEAYYGSDQQVFSMPEPLTLEDISSEEAQDNIIKNRRKSFKEKFLDNVYTLSSTDEEYDKLAAIPSGKFIWAKKLISEIMGEPLPHDLFTPAEVCRLSELDPSEIVLEVNTAIAKEDYVSKKVIQMEADAPIEQIVETCLEQAPWQQINPWQLNISMDGKFNAWLLEECKSFEQFCFPHPFLEKQQQDRESFEKRIMSAKKTGASISPDDSVNLFSYGLGVSTAYTGGKEFQRSLEKLKDKDYAPVVGSIVSYLEKSGAKEKGILDAFDKMEAMAKTLVGQRDRQGPGR